MIISASRRTDIPSYYSKWFFRRLSEGFVLVRNPMNIHQVSRVSLSPSVVDGIVFWTKNPYPMMSRLDLLKDYAYYFQFTLNPYGRNIEQNLPEKKEIMSTFKTLSEKIGREKVIWRYDPILLNDEWTISHHISAFEYMTKELSPYTEKVVISFLDFYQMTERNTVSLSLRKFSADDMDILARELSAIAHSYGLEIETCAEAIDLEKYGIKHSRCVDDRLLSRISGYSLNVGKDKNQRLECGCVSSIDIGEYNTCKNGCLYCYANFNPTNVINNRKMHDWESPLLIGTICSDDKITERKMKTLKDGQLSLF